MKVGYITLCVALWVIEVHTSYLSDLFHHKHKNHTVKGLEAPSKILTIGVLTLPSVEADLPFLG